MRKSLTFLDSRDVTNIPRMRALELGQPWHHRAERWITRRLKWLIPAAVLLTIAMKLALYR